MKFTRRGYPPTLLSLREMTTQLDYFLWGIIISETSFIGEITNSTSSFIGKKTDLHG
jgi:hypothetical protein